METLKEAPDVLAQLENLIFTIVDSIVDSSDEIDLTIEECGNFISVQIKVSDSETGKVIGRSGTVAEAIRTIARSVVNKTDPSKKVVVEIIEPDSVLKTKRAARPQNWNSGKQHA